jgi:hypothetical protein
MFFSIIPTLLTSKLATYIVLRSSWTASAIIAGIAAVALFACAHTFANAEETSTRVAREHHACAVIMGLPQPGELYDACIASLRNSLSQLDQARLISRDRRECAEERLKPGTPAFANCVLDAEEAKTGTAGKGAAPLPVEVTPNFP